MDKELRILIVEDVPADAELEEYELGKSGLVFTSKVVDTREAFLKELDEFFPDIILSDYDLPTFDGLAALRIAKEKSPDIPFILVSGKVGEEFAIEKIKDGATDYVLKNNLKRLVPSVNRALQEAEEIIERKRLRRELQESEKLYRLLAENTHDMITRHLPDGTYLYVSPACRTLFGYEPEELIGTNAFAQMHPEDVKRIMTITQEAIKMGRANVAQYRHRTKDGRYIWVETVGKIVKNEMTGDIEDIICVVRDIAERKQAEEAIKRNASQWQKTFDSIKNLIMLLDKDFKIVRVNMATRDFLGMPFDKIIGQYCFNLMHGTDEPPPECPFTKLKKALSHEESIFLLKDRNIWVSVSIDPVFNEKGELIQAVHIIEDISERKNAMETIETIRKQNLQILQSVSEGILGLDKEGKLTFINPSAARMLGYTTDELIGKERHGTCHHTKPDGTRFPENECPIYATIKDGLAKTVNDEIFWKKDGTSFFVEYTSTPIKEMGELVGAVVTFRNIAERQ